MAHYDICDSEESSTENLLYAEGLWAMWFCAILDCFKRFIQRLSTLIGAVLFHIWPFNLNSQRDTEVHAQQFYTKVAGAIFFTLPFSIVVCLPFPRLPTGQRMGRRGIRKQSFLAHGGQGSVGPFVKRCVAVWGDWLGKVFVSVHRGGGSKGAVRA